MQSDSPIASFDSLKTETLVVDWHNISADSFNTVTMKLNVDGTVSFKDWDHPMQNYTSLESGTWQQITVNNETLIEVIAPQSVASLGDHFNDDGSLYFVEHLGFVRQVWKESQGGQELLFNDVAKDNILAAVDVISPPPAGPESFSTEYLAGKTLYVVWFGDGTRADENGNAINESGEIITDSDLEEDLINVAVVQAVTFNATPLDYVDFNGDTLTSDGTSTVIGVKNVPSIPEGEEYPYVVDDAGVLRFTDEQDQAYAGDSEGNVICDSSHPDYLKTHFIVNGVFDNVELFFFDKQVALDYANGLSESIPACD